MAIGEAGLQLLRYGPGEARISGVVRVDGILRGLGGLYAGSFTTPQRDAIPAGSRPYGLIILNLTNNRIEWNQGSDAVPSWQPVSPPIGAGAIDTAQIADNAITNAKMADAAIGTNEIVNGAISNAKVADGAINSAKISDGSIGSSEYGPLTIKTVVAAYTLLLADAWSIVEVNTAGAVNVTIPPNATAAFPIGTNIVITQVGAGQTTVVAGAGVTLRSNPGAKLASQWAVASLYKRAADEWVLAGNLVP